MPGRVHTDIDPQALGGVNLPSAYGRGEPELYCMADSSKPRRRVVKRGAPPQSTRSVVSLEEIEEEKVEWQWRGRIAKGKLAILDGDPSMGKSCFTLDRGGEDVERRAAARWAEHAPSQGSDHVV
jgi:hypothetical protein